MPLLMISIDVMLAQLPRHTIAKKVENYEHLDLLWGMDVDKVVFPHVLDFLKTYAEPVDGAKSRETQSHHEINSTSPPAYSKSHPPGLRKRGADTAQRESGVSYAQVADVDSSHHGQGVAGLSDANVVAEGIEGDGSRESDSDETMGEDHATKTKNGVSFAGAAQANAQDDTTTLPMSTPSEKNTNMVESSPEESATAIDKSVASEISCADMAK